MPLTWAIFRGPYGRIFCLADAASSFHTICTMSKKAQLPVPPQKADPACSSFARLCVSGGQFVSSGRSGWLARGERIEPWPINEPNCFRSGMPQPRDPARTSSAPRQTKKTADPAPRPRPPQGPVTAREWDVAHAAALRALLTQPPTVLPNQVGDPLLPLQIGIWDALVALLRPGRG